MAVRLSQPVGANVFPFESEWERAAPICFSHDWQGKNQDPLRQTEVKVLWREDEFYLRFRCRYCTIHVFRDVVQFGRRDELWDRDVAEVFLQRSEEHTSELQS